jgi:putative transposase
MAIREAYPMSERQACKLAGMAASSYRYQARRPERDAALKERLTALAQKYPRFGSPRLCVLVRREQIHNHKRVERIYRACRNIE